MYLKQLLVIASYTAGILAASSVAQEVINGFSTLESTVDSLAQKIGASKTSLLSFSHTPGILTDSEVSGAMEPWMSFKTLLRCFIPTGSVSYEECEDMVASARRVGRVIGASIKAAADHKSAAYTLPFVGSVVPVTKLALLHFQRTTEDLGATFVSKQQRGA
ncbi:hypothetical protein D9756_010479 [Leucocoprinus leucothites]|uniref:Uncharacterized protein n=1 Tax=Leucocoprinus leucothites TaxID=201217 RepID=A0A8H5CUP3_9AGAR|nr:hypothetical protein D9756_010479 [Leucoagaricus leucothites]